MMLAREALVVKEPLFLRKIERNVACRAHDADGHGLVGAGIPRQRRSRCGEERGGRTREESHSGSPWLDYDHGIGIIDDGAAHQGARQARAA